MDLDKPPRDAAAAGAPRRPTRQRFERYEDDFIDDSELERAKGGPAVKTKYSGFFVNQVGGWWRAWIGGLHGVWHLNDAKLVCCP